jgi:3-oxocholest-4-en-26-oate---CoA ligase
LIIADGGRAPAIAAAVTAPARRGMRRAHPVARRGRRYSRIVPPTEPEKPQEVESTVPAEGAAEAAAAAAVGEPVEFTLTKVFDTLVQSVGGRECLVWQDRRLTYDEVAERSRRLGAYLFEQGLGVRTERERLAGHESGQDSVALALYNGNEYLESMLGAYRARLAPFNVNYRYVGEELRYLLNDARPRALIYHASLAPTLAEVLPTLDAPPDVLLQVADESENALLPGAVAYEDALAAGSPLGPPVEPSPDDLYILYTGGTTGMPKGVLWRQHDIFIAAMGGRTIGTWEMVTSYEGITERVESSFPLKLLVLPPLMHGAAQWAVFMLLAQGATIVFPDNPRRVDPDDVWRTVEREKVNTMTIVGDAVLRPLVMQLDRADYDLSSLFAVGNGGAPLTPAVRELALARLPDLIISDSAGSSETGAQMHSVSNDSGEAGTFRPGPGTVVIDENLTTVLPPGHEGNGWLAQAGNVPLGYLGDAEKTARTFPVVDGTRYSIPGDRARHRLDGQIQLLGRDSVTVNSGGEKIFVEEVERAIAGHPAVADVVVTGRPSERWGQEVVAVVQLAEGADLPVGIEGAESITAHASSFIARYKLPKAVVFVDLVQRSPSGKADYRWAAERAVKG